MPARGQRKPWPFLDPGDPRGMPLLARAWVETLRVRGLSKTYAEHSERRLLAFVLWCQQRSVTRASDVTKPMIEQYQRWLFHFRRETPAGRDEPLNLRTQHHRLSAVKLFFRWLAKNNYILSNPASEIELPKTPLQRPPDVLTVAEVERVLAQPDLETPTGLRDRAIFETFYSTGVRRSELTGLSVADLNAEAGLLRVRHGKGGKERIVPIGARALAFIDRYLADSRPQLAVPPDDGTLFLTVTGKPFWPDNLSDLARRYLKQAGVGKVGACHLFRHTAATVMLDNGADIRFIQEMLGHGKLETTQIYTHVSIKKLKQIHEATHPGASIASLTRRPEDEEHGQEDAEKLLSFLAAEPDGDVPDDE